MASRWRIRHKLLLGLALAVGIMALLLCGTLRGLWSYYLTTNSIRAKLAELSAAEELKSAVTELVTPDNLVALVETNDQHVLLRKVREALIAYAERLDENLGSGRGSHRGLYVDGDDVRQKFESSLDSFQDALRNERKDSVTHGGDIERKQRIVTALKKSSNQLCTLALDLRSDIKAQLDNHLSESRGNYQAALWILVPSSIVGLLLMAGLMRSFTAWIFSPIRDLEMGVSRVANGDLNHRIVLNSGDEMEDLARAFNEMLGRLCELYADLNGQVNERSRQLVRSERLASVGFLAAGVAHEINNPLASIAFCGEALEARLASLIAFMRSNDRASEEHEVFSKYLKMIQNEAFRCKHITERLLEFSRTGEPRRESADLRQLVQAVLDVTQHLSAHKDKQIILEVPPERAGGRISAFVNADEIKSVVLNLVVNALENMEEGGKLVIRLGQYQGQAELRFTDTGCGMTPEVLDNIFEPFFTRSRSGKGTGLGLTISHLIICQHGGEITASSPGPGQGSTFTVRLPIHAREMSGTSGVPTLTRGTDPEMIGRAA